MSTILSPSARQAERYEAPPWAPAELTPPAQRLRLAHLPTPIHRWAGLPGVDSSTTEVWIKRDDCTGCELSGNKIRKLEFLLAEALAAGCDRSTRPLAPPYSLHIFLLKVESYNDLAAGCEHATASSPWGASRATTAARRRPRRGASG
jgi:hypothetical protein